jgi:hypothetical protein
VAILDHWREKTDGNYEGGFHAMISLNEAAKWGIERIRKPIWATPEDHLKIDIVDGKPGPWVHLFAPFNTECNGRDPVDVLWILQWPDSADVQEFEPYRGPLPNSPEYLEKVEAYRGVLGESRDARSG